MLILRSEELLIRVDPRHGAEILDLVDLRDGRQLLGRLPFGSEEPREGPLEEADWIAGWRGGWQLCAPNPGSPCRIGEAEQGFHGRASHEPWQVLEAGEREAELGWTGLGIEIRRRLRIEGPRLVTRTRFRSRSSSPLPVAALEHVSLGLELLDPVLRLELPGGRAIELPDAGGPVRAPDDAPRWPRVARLDGSVERLDRIELRERELSRFVSVQDLPEGWVVARGERNGLRLDWDVEVLPHAWLWFELRANGGPFRRLAEIVAIEPTNVPHSLGLERAVAAGQALSLAPGAELAYEFGAEPLGPA